MTPRVAQITAVADKLVSHGRAFQNRIRELTNPRHERARPKIVRRRCSSQGIPRTSCRTVAEPGTDTPAERCTCERPITRR
jgi:hypothetical protein